MIKMSWRLLETPASSAAAPVLPPVRLRSSDHAALEGILFAARAGVSWNDLLTALFGASAAG
jgi:hypothetical protein